MDLTDVLSDKEPEVVIAEGEPKSVEQDAADKKASRVAFQEKERAAQEEGRQAEARARDEAGKFVAKETPKEEVVEKVVEAKPPVQEMTDKERGFLATATEERRKRQELEKRLAQLEAQAQPKTPAEPEKTFWDDPEGYLKQHKETITQQAQLAVIEARVVASEAAARTRHEDFDAKVEIFAQMLQDNPGLRAHWLQQPDPAEFAYKTAKSVDELRQAGSIETIRAEAEKAARIKLESEYKAKEAALLKAKEDLPDSLSNVRGTSQPRVTWGGPAPLESILKG